MYSSAVALCNLYVKTLDSAPKNSKKNGFYGTGTKFLNTGIFGTFRYSGFGSTGTFGTFRYPNFRSTDGTDTKSTGTVPVLSVLGIVPAHP